MSYLSPEIGENLTVRITKIHPDHGLFVMTPNGYSGLIRPRDVAWNNQARIIASLSEGDMFEAKVMNILPDGKICFSRRVLLQNLQDLEIGKILTGIVDEILDFKLLIRFDGFVAVLSKKELSSAFYRIGDEITATVIDKTTDDKGRVNVKLSVIPFHSYFSKQHTEGDKVSVCYVRKAKRGDDSYAVVSIEGLFNVDIPDNKIIEPIKSSFAFDLLEEGEELEFVYTGLSESKGTIQLDMRPILKERDQEKISKLREQLSEGDIVYAEVKKVGRRDAKIQIEGTDFTLSISRDELSPNKVFRASDEVFVGERIKVAYIGAGEDGSLQFSRRFFVKDKYDEKLYDMALQEILATMDIHTTRFVGKVISINGSYFLSELMTITSSYSAEDGKLLIDPVNGKSVLVILGNRLRNLVEENQYYAVDIELADKERRLEDGTPYMFHITSPNIKLCQNPYKETVQLSFKQHTSPNTNAGMARLLGEVGQNLYTTKKRMFFELLQNADDAAPVNGVKVKLQLDGEYFVLTHDGYPFNKHDFTSITSAARSTKSSNKKKTGYKGIGFKSVFTNSTSVYIKSGGFYFAFDKELDIYNHFDDFYFQANEMENDHLQQVTFLKKFAPFRSNFGGVKDIPWQLLPVWTNGPSIGQKDTIFFQKENVAIALHMDRGTLSEYNQAIDEVFSEPRFMLFLRNTNRIQLMRGNSILTIQKNSSEDGKYISLVNSFKEEKRSENFKVYTLDCIQVNDEAFVAAGVFIQRKEKINSRGDKENYFAKVDINGQELSEVQEVPDRITSATETSLSLAVFLDENGHIQTVGKNELSFYAFLPMNEQRFKFPFFINADFIPKSDREGVQSDNPWNYFLFYNIGKAIVSMVVENASIEEKEYLNLLPSKEFETSSQDTSLLADSFNRGYKQALGATKFILNDIGTLAGSSEIIVDESKLSEYVGYDDYYSILGTTKRLPHSLIDSKILSHPIFGVEKTSISYVVDIINNNSGRILSWIKSATEEKRNKFFEWLTKDKATTPLITTIPTLKYGDTWISYTKASNTDKYVLTTVKLSPVVGILKKMGFVCSESVLDNHTLCKYLRKQEEKKLYSAIASSDMSTLDFQDRLALFNCAGGFDGIGDDTLAKWPVFKNFSGSFAPLNRLFSYNESCPEWLRDYMIMSGENHKDLNRFLVKEENVYTSIIEPYIDDILSKTDVLTVYNRFIQSWRQALTSSLIKKNVPGIISVIERSDDATKLIYIKSLSSLNLNTQSTYQQDSLEYRIIKLAALNDQSITAIRAIITVNGVKLKAINIKDQVSITYNGVSHSFMITEIVPAYSSPVSISTLASQFNSIDKASEIFAVEEMPASEAMTRIIQYFNNNPRTRFQLCPKQFCFMMLYRKSSGYSCFGSSLGQHFSMSSESFFKSVLDYCYSTGIGSILNEFLKDPYVQYPYDKNVGKFFDADEYTLISERAPSVITSWADTPEKKSFIIQLGFHNAESQEILRRKSFKQDKLENVWNLTDTSIIHSFLEWVRNTFTLPVTATNQVKILEDLFQTIRLSGKYVEQDFVGAKEWTNDLYLKWKRGKDYSIYVLDGELPYRGIYKESYLFKTFVGEFVYFSESKKLFISSNREPEVVLADVYSKQGNPFTKDDWSSIFLVSTSIVNEKDEIIAELQQRIEELSRKRRSDNEAEVEEHGKDTEKDNTDERSRYEINRDARIAAKEFLDCLSDYDCSEWNPEEGRHIIKDIIKYKGKPITVAVLSSRSRKLYLHPRAFAELMEDPDNLLLNYGYDNKIHSLSFDDIFTDNPNVNLIFDTDIVSPKEIASLANMYMYSKKTCFVVENPKYSQSDIIKSFGLNEKKQDGSVMLGLSDEDIFNFGND